MKMTKHIAEFDRDCDWCGSPIVIDEPFWIDDDTLAVGCSAACCADSSVSVGEEVL